MRGGRVEMVTQMPVIQTQEPPIVLQAPVIQTARPKVESQKMDIEDYCGVVPARVLGPEKPYDRTKDAKFVLPADAALPDCYVQREPLPCPKCRRIRMDDLSQAVACSGIHNEVAFLRCKCCAHRFKLAVKSVSYSYERLTKQNAAERGRREKSDREWEAAEAERKKKLAKEAEELEAKRRAAVRQ